MGLQIGYFAHVALLQVSGRMKIAIINYGMGNLVSVEKAFRRIGADVTVTSDVQIIKNADKLVLPGVGHYKSGMEKIRQGGLYETLQEEVINRKKPILGICLGMQLFTSFSEEGNTNGLGWIEGETRYFGDLIYQERKLPVPHMGWNNPAFDTGHTLFKDIEPDAMFYFVHSFAVHCTNIENSIARASYGIEFDAVTGSGNIIGTQFHPEKSHKAGLQLLNNFVQNFESCSDPE